MFTMVFNSVGLIADAFFYNMEDLPVGEKALTTVSPDGSFDSRQAIEQVGPLFKINK